MRRCVCLWWKTYRTPLPALQRPHRLHDAVRQPHANPGPRHRSAEDITASDLLDLLHISNTVSAFSMPAHQVA